MARPKNIAGDVIRLLEQGWTYAAICVELGVSKGTCSRYAKKIGRTPRAHPKHGRRNPNRNKERAPVSDRIKAGAAAEHIFVARCLLVGLECYLPVTNGGRIDVIVGRSAFRCQIKVLGVEGMAVRKCGHVNLKRTVTYNYTKDDIDFFIAVELSTFSVYVMPIEQCIRYRTKISTSTIRKIADENDLSALVRKPNGEAVGCNPA